MIFFILILFLLFIFIRNVKLDILNLTGLYLFIWITILIVYNIRLFRYFPVLNTTFYIVFFTSILFMGIGSGFSRVFGTRTIFVSYNYKKLFSVNRFLLLIVFLSFLITFLILGKPPALGGAIDRSKYYIGPIEIFYFLIYVFWFNAIYLISNKYRVKNNINLILLSLIIVILKGNKFPFIYFISIIVYYLALKNSFKVKHILYTISIIFVIFFLASFTYLGKTNTDIMFYKVISTGSIVPSTLSVLNDPLLYLTNNFMNLNNFLVDPAFNHTYGLRLFQGIFHMTRIDTIFSNANEVFNNTWKTHLQYPWLTTATYLRDVYSDFGPLGVILFPFLFGAIGSYLKRNIKGAYNGATLITLYLYHLFFFNILLSFFTFYLTSNEILTNFLAVVLINGYAKKSEGGFTVGKNP